jgi:serpin B
MQERLFMKRLEFSTSHPDALASSENNDIRALAASYNEFGQTIFANLAKASGNIVYSPVSAGVCFAMAMSGARGATQAEFLAVMRLAGQQSDVETANGKLAALLARVADDGDTEAMAYQRPTELDIANLLAITSRYGQSLVAPEYRELLRKRYDAEVFENAAAAKINAWVAERTRGHITRVANWSTPPAFVLVNAVYFNGRWEAPFTKDATKFLPFAAATPKSVLVPTMLKIAELHYFEGDGFKAVWLPYRPAGLGMAVVLPDRGVAPNALSARLDSQGLSELAERLLKKERIKVDLHLPRFSTRFIGSLTAPAQAAGLRLPFEPERADFGGVTGRSQAGLLFVGDVSQQATVDVTEQGTVATAVTSMASLRAAIANVNRPPPPTPFHVDRPFLFYILHRDSGAILFQGRIEDPR